MIELKDLSPDVLALLQGMGAPTTRSPIRKTLHDLRKAPSATDPRPTFIFSTHGLDDPPPYRHEAFPMLRWHEDGTEVVVRDEAELRALGGGWLASPPWTAPLSRQDQIEVELAKLSPEDRETLFEMQRQSRMNRLQERMSQLSDTELHALSGGSSSEPVKRGPGRPPKAKEL